jgi:Homeodomain-like domain-containing protein
MIPEAREVHLSRKDRKVLEACCRSPVTLQRDLKQARIVLLAADGRSTRSIVKEVGVQPRIVSLWRHRYADHGLEGLQDKPRPGKQPIYTKATDLHHGGHAPGCRRGGQQAYRFVAERSGHLEANDERALAIRSTLCQTLSSKVRM